MSKLTYGMMIPSGFRTDLPERLSSAKQYDLILETARAAEKLGFTSGWIFDHFYPWKMQKHKPCFECWTLQTALAEGTKSLRLGQMVTCNSYRNPAMLAKMAATLDVISKGRLELGIGAGWYKEEYEAYGYQFPAPRVRIEMVDEALEIIEGMWSGSDFTFKGQHYDIKNARCLPRPIQRPRPPIIVGGSGAKYMLRVSAKHADRINFGGFYQQVQEFAEMDKVFQQHCRVIGRDAKQVTRTVMREVIIGETDKEAQAKASKFTPSDRDPDEYAETTMIGTPEQVIDKIRELEKIGMTYFILYFKDAVDLTPLEIFSRSVMRKLKS